MNVFRKICAVSAVLVVIISYGWSGGAPAGAATTSSITIGTVCSCSGAQAASFGLASASATAWAKWTNAHGGINGHPVNLIVKDDGGDPSTALSDVKTLIKADHVIAIVGETSLVDATWASYAQQQGVPVVGGHTYESPFLSNPDFFASGSVIPTVSIGTYEIMNKLGLKHAGLVYCAEAPVCAELSGLAKLANGLTGGTISLNASAVSSTAPSYDANCESLKSADVDALTLTLNSSAQQRLTDECAQLGYKPQLIGEMSTFARSFLSDSAYNGSIFVSTNPDYTDTKVAGVRQFLSALNTYAPSVTKSPQFTYITLYPFLGGQLFAAAAKAAGIGPTSTAADVKRGLYDLKGETLDGLSSPITFTPGQPYLGGCVYAMSVKSGVLVPNDGGAPICLTKAQLTAMEQALKQLG
jgi:branched-chain amino acid transport system substrate-binding protein